VTLTETGGLGYIPAAPERDDRGHDRRARDADDVRHLPGTTGTPVRVRFPVAASGTSGYSPTQTAEPGETASESSGADITSAPPAIPSRDGSDGEE
jgi:hypothetical protein